jgi:AraC family transcriptional regulator
MCLDSSNFQTGGVSRCREVESEGNVVSPVLGTIRRRHAFSGFALLETVHTAGGSLAPHAHSNAYMIINVRGAYVEMCRGREDFCSPESVRFLPAGERHTNRFHQETLCLNAELSSKLAERYARSAVTSIAQLRSPFACQVGRKLYAELRQQDNVTELAVLGTIVDLFSLVTRRRRIAETWPGPWLLRVRDYIEEHCTSALRLDELAAVAGRHPAHLSFEFRRFFGKTISQFVRERRVLRAARLFHSAPGKVSEVAMMCGFYDQSHFTHAFGRMMGCTPTQYRLMRRLA